MVRTQSDRHTDRQTNGQGDAYIFQTSFAGGIINMASQNINEGANRVRERGR